MKIFIASCNLFKEGEKNSRKWQLYHILDPQGVKYSTFEAKYAGMVGQEINVEVKEEIVEKNGRTFTNKTIVEPRRFAHGSFATKDELRNLEARVLELEDQLMAMDKPVKVGGESLPF